MSRAYQKLTGPLTEWENAVIDKLAGVEIWKYTVRLPDGTTEYPESTGTLFAVFAFALADPRQMRVTATTVVPLYDEHGDQLRVEINV